MFLTFSRFKSPLVKYYQEADVPHVLQASLVGAFTEQTFK